MYKASQRTRSTSKILVLVKFLWAAVCGLTNGRCASQPNHSKVHFSPCGAQNLQPRSGGAIEIFALAASVISKSARRQRRACDHQYKNERDAGDVSCAAHLFGFSHARARSRRQRGARFFIAYRTLRFCHLTTQ